MLVADDLHLDVARPHEVALDVGLVTAECRLRLTLRACELRLRLFGRTHDFHAAPAAAEGRLDDERVAEFGAERRDVGVVLEELGGAGHHRHVGLLGGNT